MEVIRICYSRSKRRDYRLICGSRTDIGDEDIQKIYRDMRFCINNKGSLLGYKHILAREISNNRYILYKFSEAGIDCEGRRYYALAGYLLGAQGVRSLSYIITHYMLKLEDTARIFSDKDEFLSEIVTYDKVDAQNFCEGEKIEKVEREIGKRLAIDETHDSFLIKFKNDACEIAPLEENHIATDEFRQTESPKRKWHWLFRWFR